MKVFLTGATGFIGQALTKSLIQFGWTVIALVRNPDSPQAQAIIKLGAQCVRGDILDPDSMRSGMTGADIVIHNAGMYELGLDASGRKKMYNINVVGTENVLKLALELRIPRTVYVSSVVCFGSTGTETRDETFTRQNPVSSWYEQTKTDAHEIAQQYQGKGLPLIIVCPSQVIGPNDHSVFGYFIRLYQNNIMPPFAWSPDITNTFIYVDDLAAGIALAAQKGRIGETYFLTGDAQAKRNYLRMWAKRPGGMKTHFYLPRGLTKVIFASTPPLLRLLGLPAFICSESVTADEDRRFSSAKAQRELGWSYRSAEIMWLETLDQEIALREERQDKRLLERLKPME